MYGPLSNALNYGLERLSKIEVDGLPKFHDHIVFVPWDEGIPSDRALKGSLFKPDVVLMSLATACDFRGIKDRENLTVSQFVDEIPKKGPSKTVSSKNVPKKVRPKNNSPMNDPPKTPPPKRIGWKDVLSAVEVKRGRKVESPIVGNFTDEVPPITNEGLDELFRSPSPDPETSSDTSISQSQTRKFHALVFTVRRLLKNCTAVIPKSAGSKKRTASEAGMSSGVPSTDAKRQRQLPKQTLLKQSGTYAGEKLSDSYSISHALNLLVKGATQRPNAVRATYAASQVT